jgi:flagellar export protein FliJ
MTSRETLIRLKRLQVDDKRRKVTQIELMISEFERAAGDLDREIRAEQDRARVHDPSHFAYPTYAKAAMQRRENLKCSAADLKSQLEDAKGALAEAFEEVKKVEPLAASAPDAADGKINATPDPTRPAKSDATGGFYLPSPAPTYEPDL